MIVVWGLVLFVVLVLSTHTHTPSHTHTHTSPLSPALPVCGYVYVYVYTYRSFAAAPAASLPRDTGSAANGADVLSRPRARAHTHTDARTLSPCIFMYVCEKESACVYRAELHPKKRPDIVAKRT